MKKIAGVIAGLFGIAILAVGAQGAADKAVKPAANPLIEEMIVLDKTFQEVVSGVAVGDGNRVHDALHAMHGTMEKTHEGVESGTVKLQKNADRMNEFVQLDKAFHADLESLAIAAHDNDWEKMLSLTKKLMDGCVNCHRQFRK